MILESCVEEKGTRGKILGLGEKRRTIIRKKVNLAHTSELWIYHT
jgi:hypothetical protein